MDTNGFDKSLHTHILNGASIRLLSSHTKSETLEQLSNYHYPAINELKIHACHLQINLKLTTYVLFPSLDII